MELKHTRILQIYSSTFEENSLARKGIQNPGKLLLGLRDVAKSASTQKKNFQKLMRQQFQKQKREEWRIQIAIW
jgi:hypothetical protein